MEKSQKINRYMKYDVMRILAMILVIVVHVSAYVVIQFPNTTKDTFIIGNIFNGISRAGVPLFIMLSGVLLLDENKKFDTAKFYKVTVPTIFLLLLFWLVFYASFYTFLLPLMKGTPIKLEDFWPFVFTFKGTDYPHLWYMFLLVGLYLTIPVLRLFVKKKNIKFIVGILVACICVQFLSRTLDVFTIGAPISVTGFVTKFHLEPVTGYLGYIILGWIIDNYEIKKPYRIFIYILGILALITSILVVQFNIDSIKNIRSFVYDPLSLPAFVYGGAVFLLIKSLCKDKTSENKAVNLLSKCGFGVYMIHIVFLEIATQVIFPYETFIIQNIFVYIPFVTAIVFISSFLFSLLFSRFNQERILLYMK